MNIVVCVKQVPDTAVERTLRDEDGRLDRASVDGVINELDEYAIEEGLQLAEAELEQARRRYMNGVAPSLEVTQAQTELARARDNEVFALFHHVQARIDLGQATGTLRKEID